MGVFLFTALGLWQLDRAEQKRVLLAEHLERTSSAPMRIDENWVDTADLQYHPITAEGAYLSAYTAFLDNRVQEGRVGYQVLTAFELAADLWLWVDRGWVRADIDQSILPQVAVSGELTELKGTAYRPLGPGLALGQTGEHQRWPQRIQHLDLPWLESVSGVSALPFVLRLGPQQADGFVRQWSTISMVPEKHTAYAIQWFLFGLIALVIYLRVSFRKVAGPNND